MTAAAGRPGALLRRHLRTPDGRTLLIRPAASEDAEALVALRDAVAAEGRWLAAAPGERSPLEERIALAQLSSTGGLCVIAEVDGRLSAQLTVIRPHGGYQAHLGEVSLSVAAQARGIGLGSALLAVAAEWAQAVGIAKLWLAVFPDNERALAVYARAGYVEEGRQRDHVRVAGESRDLLLMGLAVRPAGPASH
ncbi:MAG TPA: GNAT family N-acetyltransferase [Candidatus Dormibacteraeota bacterium]